MSAKIMEIKEIAKGNTNFFKKESGTPTWRAAYLNAANSILYLDFNLNTAGEFELHQGVNSLSGRAVDVDQTLVV